MGTSEPATPLSRYRLGELVFDPVNRTVERDGKVESLPKLSFRLLACLVRHAPDAVDHDQLVQEVWRKAFVSPETVTQRVKLLRAAIGDDSQNPRFIETRRGHGYRLIPPVETIDRSAPARRRRVFLPAVLVLLVAGVALTLYSLGSRWAADGDRDTPSVAVLPFSNLSPEPEQEYFSDGLSDELINLIAQVPDLRVAARTSSFEFKGQNFDIRTIAARLNVSHVLEGSVRKSGDQIRVTAQLIEADSGFHLWSETYERALEDVFAIQDDIAKQVARALEVTLLGQPPSRPQASPEVYSLYLRARHFDNLKGEDNWSRAVDYYRQALAVDPSYAPAWAGLARTYRYQASKEPAEFYDGMALAREAAQRAIELDDTSAAAWANLAQIEMTEQWDWAAAESALDHAMRYGPGNAEVLHAAGELALIRGRLDKALNYFRDALARDPLSLTANNTLGIAYMNAGEYENARTTFGQLLELSPDYPWGHVNMGRVLLLENRPGEALAHFELAEPGPWRDLGHVLALDALGRQVEADVAMARLERDFSHSGAFLIATVHAWRSQHDQAFAWLERSFERHEAGLMYVVRDPVMERLHEDPRWVAFLERMGLAVRS